MTTCDVNIRDMRADEVRCVDWKSPHNGDAALLQLSGVTITIARCADDVELMDQIIGTAIRLRHWAASEDRLYEIPMPDVAALLAGALAGVA